MGAANNRLAHSLIRSWSDLSDWLEKYRDQSWLFRGEWDPKFRTLKPAVGRVGVIRKMSYTLDDEQRAFREFKRTARPYLNKEPQSEIEWMALAQHHGLPTRLLDWTSSLLVAAFFAAEKAGTRGDHHRGGGVIYCVRAIPEIDVANEGNDTLFRLKEVKTYYPPHLSPRITVQQSVFTVHPQPHVALPRDARTLDSRLRRLLGHQAQPQRRGHQLQRTLSRHRRRLPADCVAVQVGIFQLQCDKALSAKTATAAAVIARDARPLDAGRTDPYRVFP